MREKDSFYIPTIIAIFLIIYLMNAFTPLLADDYCYTYVGGMTEEKVKTFKDLFYSAEFLYKNWSGRVIYLFIAQFFLLIGKEWFNVFNSIVYVGVIYLVYLHAVGIHKKRQDFLQWEIF